MVSLREDVARLARQEVNRTRVQVLRHRHAIGQDRSQRPRGDRVLVAAARIITFHWSVVSWRSYSLMGENRREGAGVRAEVGRGRTVERGEGPIEGSGKGHPCRS